MQPLTLMLWANWQLLSATYDKTEPPFMNRKLAVDETDFSGTYHAVQHL
jgi:hypothetical protein